jgi:hypothetical protein
MFGGAPVLTDATHGSVDPTREEWKIKGASDT